MELKEERILGMDFGEKRIGIAITDPLGIFSYPLTTLNNDSNFWKNFNKIFEEFQIGKIILGLPLKEDGSDSKSTKLVRKFKLELEKRYKMEIILYDERYSSHIAQKRIIESVPSKKKRRNKSLIDKNAAAVILEDYMTTSG